MRLIYADSFDVSLIVMDISPESSSGSIISEQDKCCLGLFGLDGGMNSKECPSSYKWETNRFGSLNKE